MNNHDNQGVGSKGHSAFFWFFVTLIIIVIVPIMLFTLYQISLSRDVVFDERANYLHTTANALARGLDVSIEEHSEDISRLAENDLLKTYLADDNATEQDERMLALFREINAVINYDVLYMMDKSGKCVVSTNSSFAGNNYAFRPYFTTAVSGKPGFYMAVGVTSNIPGFYFSAPVYDEGLFVGVVVGKCRIDDITRSFRKLSDSNSMRIMLTTENGVVIATNEPSMMLNSVGVLSKSVLAELKENKQFAGRAIPSLGCDDLWEKVIAGNEDNILECVDGNSRENIAAFKKLKNSMWQVIVVEDQQVLLTHVRTQTTMLLIAGVVALLAIAAGSYFASEITAKPIRNVSKIIAQISDGDQGVRLRPDGPKELRRMCVAFNGMMDYLVQSQCQMQCDTAELLEKETTLQTSCQRLEVIFENAPMGMVLIDSQKRIVEANNSALKMLMQKKENIIGKRCDAVFCAVEERRCPIFNLGEDIDLSEQAALRNDGKQITVLKSVVKIELDGQAMLLEAFVDISGRKRTENDFEMALAGIEDASQAIYQTSLETEQYDLLIEERNAKVQELQNEVEALRNRLGEVDTQSQQDILSGEDK